MQSTSAFVDLDDAVGVIAFRVAAGLVRNGGDGDVAVAIEVGGDSVVKGVSDRSRNWDAVIGGRLGSSEEVGGRH